MIYFFSFVKAERVDVEKGGLHMHIGDLFILCFGW